MAVRSGFDFSHAQQLDANAFSILHSIALDVSFGTDGHSFTSSRYACAIPSASTTGRLMSCPVNTLLEYNNFRFSLRVLLSRRVDASTLFFTPPRCIQTTQFYVRPATVIVNRYRFGEGQKQTNTRRLKHPK